jgi:DNA-binding NarL/FixJ family response regulator
MKDKIRVLIADDHSLVRDGLEAMLQTQPDIDVIGQATDGKEAIEKAIQSKPDVVLMDIDMPLIDGLIATREIKQADERIQVLVLTAYDNEEFLFHLLEVGALGYVLKEANIEQLVTAIRAVHRGDVYLYPSMAKALVTELLQSKKGGNTKSPFDSLTVREREILKLIADGYTNQEIADLLHRSIKTIESHRTNLMKKLNLHDRIELVRYAIRKGLIKP